jgi:hypothetical protein
MERETPLNLRHDKRVGKPKDGKGMTSSFNMGAWFAAFADRFRQSETRQAIEYAANALGARAIVNGEDALIFTPPYGLLLYDDGASLQAYCCKTDLPALDLEAAKQLDFHQHGEPVGLDSWIWFPRLDAEGATAYKIQRTGRQYTWTITRVAPAKKARFQAKDRHGAVTALGNRIADDFRNYREKLSQLAAASPGAS